MRVTSIILIFFSIIMAYGYWHAKTHGALNISVYDFRDRKTFVLLKDAEIILRDDEGTLLAQGKSDSHFGTVYLSHPESGSCSEVALNAMGSHEGRNAWQRCFRQQSTWLMKWVRQIQFADVTIDDCSLENIPVSINESDADWWMWWIPLPHVGGKPYTYFSLTIRLDPLACNVMN